MWSAEPFTYRGEHYEIRDARLTPPPVQRLASDRIAGTWPRKGPFFRALRWDGYAPVKADASPFTPEEVGRDKPLPYPRRRAGDGPFDIRISGSPNGESLDEQTESIPVRRSRGDVVGRVSRPRACPQKRLANVSCSVLPILAEPPSIFCESLTYSYPGAPEPSAAGVSFEVRPGEYVGVVGPNGSSKSPSSAS